MYLKGGIVATIIVVPIVIGAFVFFTYPEIFGNVTLPIPQTGQIESVFRTVSPLDTDGDGLSDREEVERGTDPLQSDTDRDGLTDRMEVDIGTNPLLSDTDADQLIDSDERRYGTDPLNPDTDNDGLLDGREIQIGTNPRDSNTDGDRYNDMKDPQPIVRNSAVIKTKIVDTESKLILSGIFTSLLGLNPSAEIWRVSALISLQNVGSDYSSYVNFDVVFRVDGNEVKRIQEKIGHMGINESISRQYSHSITVADLPEFILRALSEDKSPEITVSIENVQYERF